jgi:hypothetical protein
MNEAELWHMHLLAGENTQSELEGVIPTIAVLLVLAIPASVNLMYEERPRGPGVTGASPDGHGNGQPSLRAAAWVSPGWGGPANGWSGIASSDGDPGLRVSRGCAENRFVAEQTV